MKKNVWRKDRNFFFFFFLEWRASDEKFRSDKCKNGGGGRGRANKKKRHTNWTYFLSAEDQLKELTCHIGFLPHHPYN